MYSVYEVLDMFPSVRLSELHAVNHGMHKTLIYGLGVVDSQ